MCFELLRHLLFKQRIQSSAVSWNVLTNLVTNNTAYLTAMSSEIDQEMKILLIAAKLVTQLALMRQQVTCERVTNACVPDIISYILVYLSEAVKLVELILVAVFDGKSLHAYINEQEAPKPSSFAACSQGQLWQTLSTSGCPELCKGLWTLAPYLLIHLTIIPRKAAWSLTWQLNVHIVN